jgi:hypothetical protein
VNHAAAAVANAVKFECKKDALRQRQSGDWVFSVVIASTDMSSAITGAAMGTRYQAVLVEIGDDEAPVDRKLEDRDKWRELGPVKQAGIRCKDVMFQTFLRDEMGDVDVVDEESAACYVRSYCNVLTRTELGKPGNDGKFLWLDLDNKYQAWKALEHG